MARTLRLWIALVICSVTGVAEADQRVFALVVTSNRGTSIAQPALAYADDDGVRYFQLFRAAAKSAEDVRLLTTFDGPTRAAYPDLEGKTRPPIRAELTAAISELATQVRAAHAAGDETALYFVFAGHGEVREGRGYLGLEDSAIDGDFIEHELVERIPADTKHVLLDSCNSFFVVNPRKPGGRRWATPDDMAFGFSARHPEVGVFLSTNAEEEVYEWSKLESGVFSHEVRSGLRGGADVDRNGRVSYSELAGFVTRANEGIVRESLRPHLFFRGPEGKRDATLFSVSGLRGGRLALEPAQTRVWIADARGERVLDLHKEAGPLTVVLPSEQGELSLYASFGNDTKIAPRAYRLQPGDGALALGDAPIELAARGERMFGELFSAPYGLQAHGEFERQESKRPKDVFGLSISDTQRAEHLLEEIAAASRLTQSRQGYYALATGLASLGAAGAMLGTHWHHVPIARVSVAGGLGLAFGALGGYLLLAPSKGEKASEDLRRQLASGQQVQRTGFLRASDALLNIERQMRRQRLTFGALQASLGFGYILFGVALLSDAKLRTSGAILLGGGVLISGIAMFRAFTPTIEERLIRVYRRDPSLSLQLSGNVDRYGGGLGLRGSF